MHSAWLRANAVVTFAATVLAGLCILATLSGKPSEAYCRSPPSKPCPRRGARTPHHLPASVCIMQQPYTTW